MQAELIERLARLRGVGDAYHDYRGDLQYFSLATKAAILAAMGCDTSSAEGLGAEIARLEGLRALALLPPVAAARGPRIGFDLNLDDAGPRTAIAWVVRLETGATLQGRVNVHDCPELWRGEVAGTRIVRRRFELPVDLPPGLHALEARVDDGAVQHCALVMSPAACYEPPAILAGGRLWGVAVQLYTVRSRLNWGIGDFDDLARLVRWLAPLGAGFIGLNPLHALTPAEPERSSPYSASNRHFLNVLYIAVAAVPEFASSARAQERHAHPEFAARLASLRSASLVDYGGVAAVKFAMLELLHAEFREAHLARGDERAREFLAFVAAGGGKLAQHALFDALDRHFCRSAGTSSGWMNWPDAYRDPGGVAVAEFAKAHATDVEFFLYLQWLAHAQLTSAQALARELGMALGLYGDYAVGASAAGSETWIDRESFRLQAEIGAPPDPLALKGQGWGIPPPDPIVMLTTRLNGFVKLLQDNMRYYGALRLDHVMSLFRLWWVPAHTSPQGGAYVHYPFHELLTVLTLESARNSCLVVGEDLGVVPDEMRAAMPEYGVYHYKVMLFEKQAGRFRKPQDFLRRALATVTTHDMPTLRGYWEGEDIALRARLNLYPSADLLAAVERERDADRVSLLAALGDERLSPQHPATAAEAFTSELAQALHLYLARSSAALAAVQIEDLLGMAAPVNVPGTSHEYPNWQRKLSADLEEILARPDLAAWLAEIDRARR